MIGRFFFLLFFCLPFFSTVSAQSLDYPSVWQCDVHKPNWYCDREAALLQIPALAAHNKRIELNAIQTAEQLRQELKRREDLAVMQPTKYNLKDYLEIWQFTQNKGARFADNWQRVVWQNPTLDYAQKHPVNNAAIKLHEKIHTQRETQQLKFLAKEHGLIFFFRSDCPYCHAMAPTLKMLTEQYGIEVLPVSLDGKGLPEFPNPRNGQGTAIAAGIQQVPALFMGSKKTGERMPIGFGMMALTEIVNRIFVLTATQPGDHF